MSNRHLSFARPSDGHGHQGLPMDYINRALDRFSRNPQRQHHRRRQVSPALQKSVPSPQNSHSKPHRSPKHRHLRHQMTSFNGPWSQDLDAFKKSVQSMPDQYKSSFASASKDVLEKLCDPDLLHIWETDSDIDNLLQLTSVIAKLCNLGTRKEKGANTTAGSMIIIAEERPDRNNFARICQLVEYLTDATGKKHLDGTVAAFGTIVVAKGWDNSSRSGREAEKTVKRINTCIERVFKMGSFSSSRKKKIVWHHGPVIHPLLLFINTTTSQIRSSLHAISITGSLDLTTSVKPSPRGRVNTLPDLSTLESYAKKLDIPIVFLDPASQLIIFTYLATYMYYYAYYIHTFLPAPLSRAHMHIALDDLTTFAFRLLGASTARYGAQLVATVKKHLDARTAKPWANRCVDAQSYTKDACRSAGKDAAIHHAVQLADAPFAPFSHGDGLAAFARLAVGPAASDACEMHVAAPVHISFSSSRIRPSCPTNTYILLPSPSQDLEKVTHSIQGLMMAVLERVRKEKGNPEMESERKGGWDAVSKACGYAFNEAQGKMPREVQSKVKFVREKLGKGTWARFGVGGGDKGEGGEGVSEAARANRRAEEAYGMGVQHQFGVGVGHQGQQPMMSGAQAPPNSPGMGQPVMMGMGAGQMGGFGQAQHHHGQGFAAGQGYGGGGAGFGGARVPQSMGGNWM